MTYFHSYVGALYVTKGLFPIDAWIFKLIDPDANLGSPTQPWQQGQDRESASHPGPSLSGPSDPVTGTNVPVSLVNQTATLRNIPINYVPSHEGPPHLPTWTVRCYINNVEKGVGVGKSQKIAKEEAAQQAWKAMGW